MHLYDLVLVSALSLSVSVRVTEFCIMFYSEWIGIPFSWMKYRLGEIPFCVDVAMEFF